MDTRTINEKINGLSFRTYLLLLLLLYCLVRIPLLLSPSESIFTGGPIEGLFLTGEGEGVRAGIAHFLIHGSKLSLWDYTAEPYGLGSLVAALWTVPFFKLFGSTLFAFKLAPFFWQLFSVIVWFWLWSSFYSARKVFLISLFLVLPSPHILEYSLTSVGSHFEVILLTAINLLLFKKVLEKRFSETWSGFLLGLAGGLFCAFFLVHFITIALILIYSAWDRHSLSKKGVFFGMVGFGFCLGVSPWLLFDWNSNWGGLLFVQTHFFFERSLESFVRGFFHLIRWDLPSFFGFRKLPNPVGSWLGIVFAVLYLYSLGWQGLRLWKRGFFNRKIVFDLESFGFFYQILFLLLMVCIVRTENRYLFPIVPFMGMTLVLAFERLHRNFKGAMIVFWVGTSLWGNVSLIRWNEMGKALTTSARSEYYNAFGPLQDRYGNDLDLFFKKMRLLLSDKSIDWKRKFYSLLPQEFFQITNSKDLESTLSFIRDVEVEFQPLLFERLKVGVKSYCHFDPDCLERLLHEYSF